MASPSYTQDLLEKLRALTEDKLVEVVDFVDFLRERQSRIGSTRDERLRAAAARGHIILPKPGVERTLPDVLPPAVVPGRPASEMVVEDRR